MSMSVAGLLFVGLATSIYMVGRAASQAGPATRVVDSSLIAYRLADELRHATHITDRSPTAIEFILADRNGDQVSDMVRYEWSGIPGDPLQCSLNRGAPIVILDEVHEFYLSYDLRSMAEQLADSRLQESSEQLFHSVSGSDSNHTASLRENKWYGHTFQPTLPASAVWWKVTRIEAELEEEGPGEGTFQVQLRPATGTGSPTSTILEAVTVDEDSLGGFAWRSFAFDSVKWLLPTQRLSIVLEHVSGNEACQIRYTTDSNTSSLETGRLFSADQGATWKIRPDAGMHIRVYGTYMSEEGAPVIVTRNYFSGVGIRLRTSPDAATQIDTDVQLLNSPELLSALWESRFDRDPTDLDILQDGAADWTRGDAAPLDQSSLIGNYWKADATLATAPQHDFSMPTTMQLRVRDTTVGGNGATFLICADWNSDEHAILTATTQLQSDGTQTLTMNHRQSDGNMSPLTTVSGLSSEFVVVRLVIVPDQDQVALRVAGADQGTYTYARTQAIFGGGFASLQSNDDGAEFDYVSIRVSQ